MKIHRLLLILATPAFLSVSCSWLGLGEDVKIVEANPATMRDLELRSPGAISPIPGAPTSFGNFDEPPSDIPDIPLQPGNADRLRLPDMEVLPSNDELKPVKPTEGSGIIARPPSE